MQKICDVTILPSAWEDLKKIEDYNAIQFDIETALKICNNILDSINHLEYFPDSGSQTPDEWLNHLGFRMVICKKHVSIYRRFDHMIYIYHIADTRTEYTKLFY